MAWQELNWIVMGSKFYYTHALKINDRNCAVYGFKIETDKN
jgi:hypothetical protein